MCAVTQLVTVVSRDSLLLDVVVIVGDEDSQILHADTNICKSWHGWSALV